ncbi:hypothetical protein [Streptomyces indicus]|uniref:UL36 very large tegument protein n=1 Tax=Streptomyces indicus TaxID=417292 RepID=A0A1G8UVX5_9ACTN|nr:hypothetical protein [Streptomyces indicus]SDJ57080.1 hypothetical protein SAMN05421806_1011056 [Streptomyces indicus]
MTAGQHADPVREFAEYLRGLVGRIDQDGGWCGVFLRRDPDGMRACLQGREAPPWDVVEALLNDLAAAHGRDRAAQEMAHARALHQRLLRHVDTRPGARERLGERLELMLKEQRYAAERQGEIGELLQTASPFDADRLRLDLAWAQDDHERASARVAELQGRLQRIQAPPRHGQPRHEPRVMPPDTDHFFAPRQPDAAPAEEERSSRGAPHPRRFARRGARYAPGADTAGSVPPTAAQTPPRGARYGQIAEQTPPRGARHGRMSEQAAPAAPPGSAPGAAARATAATVAQLIALRGAGRTGEAHVLLCEAARRPPGQLPLLAEELQRAGLGADWATLLWEAASLPPADLVAVAEALGTAGRHDDAKRLLRQGVGRPASEIGEAALVMADAGRRVQAEVLLEAFLRVRTPEEAARIVTADPDRLIPPLLKAAESVSGDCRRDLAHALRVAGFGV